jgi:hypothetical protein
LWVHVPEKHDASRPIGYLIDHEVLHYRYSVAIEKTTSMFGESIE